MSYVELFFKKILIIQILMISKSYLFNVMAPSSFTCLESRTFNVEIKSIFQSIKYDIVHMFDQNRAKKVFFCRVMFISYVTFIKIMTFSLTKTTLKLVWGRFL